MAAREDYSRTDEQGRTVLFFHAAVGNLSEVKRIIFGLAGTGVCCERLGFISHKDNNGLTAADIAARNGHTDIESLLRGEQGRMEFFE